ncbi:tRNA (adenosine(37)-N6)-threonylcarbamoyltransferase complex transferase subunit TsaD [Microgenomates group bacterium RBG_19FT_COMBO_39_10]|nr:MAG: tRNA (adenosine(37)-N6)-threonylcarbamoyltransferase complex transferase subunit TsaD [Microgenomates group bacterium RBG_19FT_COMBO_39_10]
MKILGIETSCDETAAAVVENGTKILSNAVASSIKLHQKTGGIIPEVAAREQIRCIIPIIKESLKSSQEIDALAVTVGPGLVGSLLVGVEAAKTLAYVWKKPIVPVNHLQAHLYANWLEKKKPQFPAIGLVVSGGHTDLVLLKNHTKIKWLGGTRDDAAGECFDKTARLLELGYPGGPKIAKLAEKGNPQAYDLPRPMISQDNLDCSFSGLKTAVINLKRKKKKINKANLAASIQQAIIDVLVKKTIKATKKHQVKSVLLAGGVAANQQLREQMEVQVSKLKPRVNFFVPSPQLCTDNAAYVATQAFFNCRPLPWQKIQVNPSLSIEEMVE